METTQTPITDAIEATESQFDVVQVCDDYRAACRKLEADRAALIAALELNLSIVAAIHRLDGGHPAITEGDFHEAMTKARATLAQVRG